MLLLQKIAIVIVPPLLKYDKEGLVHLICVALNKYEPFVCLRAACGGPQAHKRPSFLRFWLHPTKVSPSLFYAT
jgi:hypothetical protein